MWRRGAAGRRAGRQSDGQGRGVGPFRGVGPGMSVGPGGFRNQAAGFCIFRSSRIPEQDLINTKEMYGYFYIVLQSCMKSWMEYREKIQKDRTEKEWIKQERRRQKERERDKKKKVLRKENRKKND